VAELMMVLLNIFLAAGLFLGPGVLLNRRWPSPLPPLTIYAVSAGMWFVVLQTMNLTGVPVARSSVLAAGGLMCFGAWVVGRFSPRTSPEVSSQLWWVKPSGWEWIWFSAGGLGLLSFGLRCAIDPLSGWDNGFRWEGLALQWIEAGNLRGYPPLSAEDFERYPWVDGLAPFVAGLNMLTYLLMGSTDRMWTSLRVVGEMGLIVYAIGVMARNLWGPRGVWPALGVAGSSALLCWGVAIGQESGQLTLAFCGFGALLLKSGKSWTSSTLFWAGCVASIAVVSREYGFVLPLLGTGCFIVGSRASWRQLGWFWLPVALTSGPWFVRNMMLTGNPVYPLSPVGILPTPDFYTSLNHSIADVWGWGGTQLDPHFMVAFSFCVAGAVLVLGGTGCTLLMRKGHSWLVVWIIAVVGLWVWSVPYTAGGSFYSMRVLIPALGIGAAIAGWVGKLEKRWLRGLLATVTLLVSIDGARRAWFLPNASFSPWSVSMELWSASREMTLAAASAPVLDELVQLSGGSVIAVDKVEIWVRLKKRGARVVMLRSPDTRSVYDNSKKPDEIIEALHGAGIEVLFVSLDQLHLIHDVQKSRFLVSLINQIKPTLRWGSVYVFKLSELELL